MFTSCLVVHTLVSDYSYSTGSDGVSFGGKHPVQLQCKLLLACLQSFPVRPEMCHLNFSVLAILFLSLPPLLTAKLSSMISLTFSFSDPSPYASVGRVKGEQ